MNYSKSKLSQSPCEKLKGKEIDEILKKKSLPLYGTKKEKCKRLLKLNLNSNKCIEKIIKKCEKKEKACNPLSGRCIINKNEKKHKKVLDKKIEKKPKTINKNVFLNSVIKEESKSPLFKEISISSRKKNSKARKIQRFLKDKLITNKYTLDNRVKFAKYLKKRLMNIKNNDCIETKTFKDGTQGYTINNIIDLVKKIGTESVYGVIYLSRIKESLGGYSIVAKTMTNDEYNLQEINLMYKITNELLLTKKSKHFAAVYNYAICSKKKITMYNGNNVKRPPKMQLVSINELAHGDLKTLLQNKDIIGNDELIINLLFQTFISIGTFQCQMNYIHSDAHHGNFLYQKNNDVGYYQYKFGKFLFYLKSCGYNIIIYDYGLSKECKYYNQNNVGSLLLEDYYRIIHAFLSNKYGWGIYDNFPKKNIEDIILNFKNDILKYPFITKDDDKTFPQYVLHTLMLKLIYTLDNKTSYNNDLYTFRTPKNIINKNPYIIF